MSQRVNIQFSIDLDELPEEVERLILKFGSEIETAAEIYNDMPSDCISVQGLKAIQDLRMSLAKADHILDDTGKIVSGYMQMSTQSAQAEAPDEPHVDTVNPFGPSTDSLDNLEEKLRAFTNRMSDEQPTEITDNKQ